MKTTIATKMTPEQVKQDSAREYNQREWEKNVDRYMKYGEVEFYKVEKDATFSYDRFYVVYTIEGIRFMNQFSYSASLSSNGFVMVHIAPFILKGDKDIEMLPEGKFNIFTSKFLFDKGDGTYELHAIKNDTNSRKFMQERTAKLNQVFTNSSVY